MYPEAPSGRKMGWPHSPARGVALEAGFSPYNLAPPNTF